MAKLQIQQILGVNPWQNKGGGQMYGFTISGLLDGQIVTNAQINATDPNRYQPGQLVDVVIVSQDQHGIKLKKLDAPPQAQAYVPQPAPVPQPYVQPVVQPQQTAIKPYNEPEPRQTSIERQSSLAQAIARCSALANVFVAQKKYKEAEEVLAGKHILQVATYLNKFVKGEVSVVMGPTEIAHAFGYERTAMDVFGEEPAPEEDPFADEAQ